MSGSKGLVPHFFGDTPYSVASPQFRYLAQNGAMAAGTYNPFKRNGFLTPSNTGTKDVTISGNSYFAPIACFDLDRVRGEIYMTHGNIIAFGDSTHDILFANDRAISSVDNWFDTEIYTINGVRTFFYMYKKTGTSEGRIGIKKTLDGVPAYTDIWLGTGGTVSGTFGLSTTPTKMIVADNSYMYILDNNAVHKVDGNTSGGANGTVTANVLTFPFSMALTDGIDYRGSIYMGLQSTPNGVSVANFTSFCGIYIWDRNSTSFGVQDFVPIPQGRFIRKIYVSPAGTLRCIVTTSNGETAIVEYNGASFKTIARLGISAFPQYFDSAVVVDNGIWWQSYDGLIYFHGSPSYEMKEGLYQIGNIAPSTAVGGSMLYASDSSDYTGGVPTNARTAAEGFYVAYQGIAGDTNSFVVKKWFPHADYSTKLITPTFPTDIGNVYTPVVDLPVYSKVGYVKMNVLPLTDDGAGNTATVATVKVFYNHSTTAAATITVTRNMCLSGIVDIPCAKSNVIAIQLKVEFNTAQNAGTYDFQPYSAYVDYDQIIKRK